MITCEATFTMTNTQSGTTMSTTNTGITILYGMNVAKPAVPENPSNPQYMGRKGCGKISASLTNGNFVGLQAYSSMDMEMDMQADFGGGPVWLNMTAGQSDSAVMAVTAGSTTGAGKAQTTRIGTFNMTHCGATTGQCAQMSGMMAAQLLKKQAAMMAFDDSKAGIQTNETTATLGVSTGNTAPQTCLDRGTAGTKVYPKNYNLFDATTGELWQPPNPNGYVSLYNYNTTTTDPNGKLWAKLDYPLWKADGTGPADPQPVGRLNCFDGESCYYDPEEERADLGGQYFGKNALPDGMQFTNAALSGISYQNDAGYTGTTVLRWEDALLVPPTVAASQCSALTLSAMSPAPDSLDCGSASAKNVAQEGNKNMAVPIVPTVDNYVNGKRVN